MTKNIHFNSNRLDAIMGYHKNCTSEKIAEAYNLVIKNSRRITDVSCVRSTPAETATTEMRAIELALSSGEYITGLCEVGLIKHGDKYCELTVNCGWEGLACMTNL